MYTPISGPASGEISGIPPELTYTPAPNFYGQDSFTFSSDGSADSEPATITINVNPVNDPPRAVDDVVTTHEDGSALIHPLANDADVEGDHLVLSGFTQPASGVVADNGDGSLTYTPALNFNGQDSLLYTVSDGNGGVDTGAVDMIVTPVNDPPIARAGQDRTVERGDSVTLDGSASEDADADPLFWTWSFVSSPPGSAAIFSDPTAPNPTFTPDIKGMYVVRLTVHDGALTSEPDGVVITANPRIVLAPSLVGLPREEAETAIADADLTLGAITEEHDDEAPAGIVIGQNPGQGVSIEEGEPVDLVVSLGRDNAPPTVNISAVPEVIQAGESVTLDWSSTGATSCFIEPDIGPTPTSGYMILTPEHGATYKITAVNEFGASVAHVLVTVTGDPAPAPEGSFGERYEDLVPSDATLEAYDPWRFTMLTGLVRNMDGEVVSEVIIDIHGHPEYGTVRTDLDGRFSIPVEGGAMLTVVYQKEGFITSHRKVEAPWNDTAIVETMSLITEDPASTTVAFSGDPDAVVTHRSTEVADEFGSRSATLVFEEDNRAYAMDAQGDVIQELGIITIRATEFTTLASMPAVLPPTSAYTYCVELRVDGVERVRFEKPVVVWVDNFPDFDVGEIVPVGYYNRDRGVWTPSKNGVVAQLLDTDWDGIVDALDATGDGLADDLDNDGLFNDEVEGLDDEGRYLPDATFWRFAVTHFSPWDCNWPPMLPPRCQ